MHLKDGSDADIKILDVYPLKKSEKIWRLSLVVKVMFVWPHREDYCQAEVGDSDGTILIQVFKKELVDQI